MRDSEPGRPAPPSAGPAETVSRLGIPPGSALVVESDLVRLAAGARRGGRPLSIDGLIDELLGAVGPGGTLLLPAFSWDFIEKKSFSVRRSVPWTGAMPVRALARGDFERTWHPTHSFLVKGRLAGELVSMRNDTAWGVDSPFGLLRRENAILLTIGLHYRGCLTFVHHVEEMTGVPHRRMTVLEGEYEDASGRSGRRTCRLYARRGGDWRIIDDYRPMGAVLQAAGAAARTVIDRCPFDLVRLGEAFPLIERDIREHSCQNIYRILHLPGLTAAKKLAASLGRLVPRDGRARA